MNNAALRAIRNIAFVTGPASERPSYPFTLSFTREFTKGTLEGLTHDDSLGFCNKLDAEEWVCAINRANKAGKLSYRVTKWSVR